MLEKKWIGPFLVTGYFCNKKRRDGKKMYQITLFFWKFIDTNNLNISNNMEKIMLGYYLEFVLLSCLSESNQNDAGDKCFPFVVRFSLLLWWNVSFRLEKKKYDTYVLIEVMIFVRFVSNRITIVAISKH